MANALVNVEFIPNSRGGRSLVYQGFKYRVKRTRGTSIHWKCCIATCPATINTSNDLITTQNQVHNHAPNQTKIVVDKFLATVKNLVKEDSRPIPTMYQEELNGLRSAEVDATSEAPTFYSIQSSLYRSRAKELPPLPRQRSDTDLPDLYTKTSTGDNFLLKKTGNLLIFSTSINLQHLAAADVIFGDGTFSICPKLFYQLYTVHAFVGQKMFPPVFALLPDKKQSTYKKLFDILKLKCEDRNLRLSPNCIVTDCEVAVQQAAVEVFQCQQLKGCMFRFRQAIWRSAQRFGLQSSFTSDPSVKLIIRRACALPLVRLCDIDDVWMNALEEGDLENAAVLRFTDCVTETWVENPGRSTWNHFNTDGARTTNHLEGRHAKMNKTGHSHPNLFKFVSTLKREQSSTEMSQLLLGGRQPPRKQKYRDLEQRLQREKNIS